MPSGSTHPDPGAVCGKLAGHVMACTHHFTTYIPAYRDVIHQIEREQAAIAGRTGVRVEPSLVEFSCADEESWAFFADVGGFVETFTTPYRGLWRHAHRATTKIYETPRGGEGRPSGLWNVGDLDSNSSDEFVLLEAGRYHASSTLTRRARRTGTALRTMAHG